MRTVYVYFSNHFDLVWRRCWDRAYDYHGGRYASYRRVEELCLLRNLDLAERGEGAYAVEQALSVRAFLERYPDALPRLKALYRKGLFEMCGAGEAIIDINLCGFETMCRNLASGVRYCRDVLGMPPLLANHGDGFGSSAQFPQVIRQCGFPGINGLSYSYPDNQYWRGLDGSTVFVGGGAPGRGYFFDHCYHEPCRVCHGRRTAGCAACEGTGFDMPQNVYPPFEPVADDRFAGDVAQYNVCSEEMLPPENFSANFRLWEKAQPDVQYRWGTPQRVRHLWEASARAVDDAPANKIASRVENNPVQTGCYVSRIRIKQEARRCESILYGWETALALTMPAAVDAKRWEGFFRELPLFFFHDAITGTHQDDAYTELRERMATLQREVPRAGLQALRAGGWRAQAAEFAPTAARRQLAVFNPDAASTPLRIPLPVRDWRQCQALVAETADGQRLAVPLELHTWSPALPLPAGRLIVGVGPTARTRPEQSLAHIEAVDGLAPLAWSSVRLVPAPAPEPGDACELRNDQIAVRLGEHGVEAVTDLVSGGTAAADLFQLGELLIEDDEGDPWGTRRRRSFRRALGEFTHRLGTLRFAGYQEAYYGGVYEPNLRFGREPDPSVFALEWYVTVRLVDGARRVDFAFELFWKAADRRVRAVFPVQAPGDNGWYSIPGGWLERPRYEQTDTFLWSPNGDWPALYFAAAQPAPGKLPGWGVVNYGTPATRIEDGRILVSLLRAPGFGHCLERYAQAYPMPTSGIRDGGWHRFTLSLVPHAGVADMPRLALAAAALNQAPPAVRVPREAALPAPALHVEGAGIQLVAAKLPFDGRGARGPVLRLLNLRPAPVEARLCLGGKGGGAATVCNLVEEGGAALVPDGTLTFRAFEVKTVRLGIGARRGRLQGPVALQRE